MGNMPVHVSLGSLSIFIFRGDISDPVFKTDSCIQLFALQLEEKQSLLAQSDLFSFNKSVQKGFIGEHAPIYSKHCCINTFVFFVCILFVLTFRNDLRAILFRLQSSLPRTSCHISIHFSEYKCFIMAEICLTQRPILIGFSCLPTFFQTVCVKEQLTILIKFVYIFFLYVHGLSISCVLGKILD